MKYTVFLIFSLFLFPKSFQEPTKKNYLPLKPTIKKIYTNSTSPGLHKAILTGDKSELDRKTKRIFKRLGLLHLLTPSGLHLSSVLFLFSFSSILEVFILIAILAVLFFTYNGYDSMVRVTIFRVIYKLIKRFRSNPNLIFISYFVTIIISISLGHYSNNPLSFLYSFIFWGTILYFRKNKILLILMLHLVQILVSVIMSSEISPLSLLINPVFTAGFSLIYPVLFLLSFIPQEIISTFIIDMLVDIIASVEIIDIFPAYSLSPVTVLISIILLIKKKNILCLTLLCLNINTTNEYKAINESQTYWNLPAYNELIEIKKNKLHFIDRVCKVEGEIFCKKKPSHLGGPKL